ncbi:TolA protein, putative, partial [Hondaea fermentalgiana]
PAFEDNADQAEKIWTFCRKCEELDPRGAEGNELDEFKAHILLEQLIGAVTVTDMRKALRDVDVDFNKMVSLTEFLVYHYKVKWEELVHAPQGSDEDQAKLVEAQQAVEESQRAQEESTEQLRIARENEEASRQAAKEAAAAADKARDAEAEAKAHEESAKASEAAAKASEETAIEQETQAKASEAAALEAEAVAVKEETEAKDAEAKAVASEELAVEAESKAKNAEAEATAAEQDAVKEEADAIAKEGVAAKAEDEQRKAEAAVQSAVEAIKAEETAFKNQCDKLRGISEDESAGAVKRGTAANELAQLLVKDPMPLQRARILEEAALRKQTKLTQAAAEARDVARVAAESAKTQRAK